MPAPAPSRVLAAPKVRMPRNAPVQDMPQLGAHTDLVRLHRDRPVLAHQRRSGAPLTPKRQAGWNSAPWETPLPPPPPPAPPAAAHLLLDVLAGAALGALLGLLVGLSASPVVGSRGGGADGPAGGALWPVREAAAGPGRRWRTAHGGFGFAATLVLLAGLHLRSHHWLSPDVAELKRQIAEVGVTDPAEQRQLPAPALCLLPDGVKATAEAGKASGPGATAAMPPRRRACAELRRLQAEHASAGDLLIHLGTGSEAARRAAAGIQAHRPRPSARPPCAWHRSTCAPHEAFAAPGRGTRPSWP